MDIVNKLLAERLTARGWEERGYVVTIEPESSLIPSVFGCYRPELLAEKDGEHVMVDIKSPGTRIDEVFYNQLSKRVQQQPGWRLLLVSVSDEELHDDAASRCSGANDIELRRHLRDTHQSLTKPELATLLLPRFWTIYMIALRLLATTEETEIRSLSDLSFLNQAYAKGVMAWEEYEEARRLLIVRNLAVTGLEQDASLHDCECLHQMALRVLDTLPAAKARAGVGAF